MLPSFARLPWNWRCRVTLWVSDLVTVQGRSAPVQSLGGPSRANGYVKSPAMAVAAMVVVAIYLAAMTLAPCATSRGVAMRKT